MDHEVTRQLADMGVSEWNAWAQKQLSNKPISTGVDDPTFDTWLHNARADFRGRKSGDSDFSGFIFPSEVDFRNAIFDTPANFTRATFVGEARFDQAQFKKGAVFFNAKFDRSAAFSDVEFGGEANFIKTQFSASKMARFDGARFLGLTDYVEADFSGDNLISTGSISGTYQFLEGQIS